MFIDIHTHAYRRRVPFVTGFCEIHELLERNASIGIDRCCILPIVSPEIYFPQTNEEILDMAAEYPDRVVPFCNIDPRTLTNSPDADFVPVLEYYKEKGCRGIGEVMPNMELMDPKVQNLFRCAEKAGMSITYDGSDVKTGDFGLYDDPGLPQLEHTLQRFPKLKIFGHGPVFWSEIGKLETVGSRGYVFNHDGGQVGRLPKSKITEEGAVPRLFRLYPNLLGDLSDFTAYNAFARDEEYGPKFMTEFQDRLYFGTDMCFPTMPVPLPELMIRWNNEGRISDEVFYKIARGNAEKFLGLN
ncbi:MAG: amidohydrolase family protein [Clostridiales bacterium]|jgi:predicted TIM-barrel fold metal-dependent hydrolase|nr:amidohydrolase family protein [Clostridiales bacterium]